MKLYSYWRSTTSFRVRATLNLKDVAYETVSVDLAHDAQNRAAYRSLSCTNSVPVLVLDDGTALTQSMAIMEYLDAVYPEPQLVPHDPVLRARVTGAAQLIAMDIHPVNNLRVMRYLESQFGATKEQCTEWMIHWMQSGFLSLEQLVRDDTDFAFGATPNIADICITAQTYNAHRWGVDLAAFPNIARIERNCLAVPAIAAAHPDLQPDAQANQ